MCLWQFNRTSKATQYKDSKMTQPAIIVLNSKFEIIFFWKKSVDSPFGRPLPSALIPIIISEAEKVKDGNKEPSYVPVFLLVNM